MQVVRAGLGALALAGAIGLPITAATAADLIAITDQREVIYFSDADPGKAARRGLHGTGGWMIGFDLRPADGMLYGVTSEGAILSINGASGVASFKGILSVTLERASGYLVDFNPVVDRLRIIGTGGQNLRVNVDTGATIEDGRIKGGTGGAPPQIAAGAYSNAIRGATATQLYVFDSVGGGYSVLNPPNDGVMQPVGASGLVVDAADIASVGTNNVGFLVSKNVLYGFDPASGAVRMIGPIGGGVIGKVIDIVVMPPRP